jgi:hypothetical protein
MCVIGVKTSTDLNKGYIVRPIEIFYFEVDSGRAETVFYLVLF